MAQLLVWPYWCYGICEVTGCSGIVGILVCGLLMARYLTPVLTQQLRSAYAMVTSMLAHTMETFVSIYFGMALSSYNAQTLGPHTLGYAGLAAATIVLTRGTAVTVLCGLMNCCRRSETRFTARQQFVVWASGLRGSIAFALVGSTHRAIQNVQLVHVMEVATITVTLVTIGFGVIGVPLGLKGMRCHKSTELPHTTCCERCEHRCLLPLLHQLQEAAPAGQ